MFFGNPRRLVLKIHSHAHEADSEAREEAQAKNAEFYERVGAKIGEPL